MARYLEESENFRILVPKYPAHLIDFDMHYTPIFGLENISFVRGSNKYVTYQ